MSVCSRSFCSRSRVLLPVLWGLVCAGCVLRQPDSAAPDQLPLPLMAPGAVVVEIVFVSIDPAAADLEQELWQQADEQIIPTARRRQLALHGLRCGLVGARPPEALVALYQRSRQSMDVPAGSAVVPFENLVHRQRRMQLRHEQRREIVMPGDPLPELQLELHEEPPRQLRLQLARGLLAIRGHLQPDGAVRIELTPEIQHGSARPRWRGDHVQGRWQWLSEQQREVLRDLVMSVTLGPGQTLLVSCRGSGEELGHHFFTRTLIDGKKRNLLLIRLAQTQLDGVFRERQIVEPLVSNPE